jgi:cysteine desulfurase
VNKVYLNNIATTRLDPLVLEEMLPLLQEGWGSSTQIHSFGRGAKKVLEEARSRVARILGTMPEEIIFTSGGTEANNLALLGVARGLGYKGRIITSQVEHPSVLETCKALQAEGHEVVFVPVSSEGLVDPEAVRKAMIKKTLLVSILSAEGETGAIQPIGEISMLARERGILFHTDACQVMGKVASSLKGPGIDLLSLSAHKFHGPMGIGALFVRVGTRLSPFMYGGLEERGIRPGTISPALAVGMAKAAELAEEYRKTGIKGLRLLEERLLSGIKEVFKAVGFNGPNKNRLPGHMSLSFPGLEAEALLLSLDLEGIAVGAGRACASGAVETSSVLLAMGLSREEALSSLHFSLSRFSTMEDVDRLLRALSKIIPRMLLVHTG